METCHRCSVCGGVVNLTYDSNKQQSVFKCSKCKIERTKLVKQQVIDMTDNEEEQILYE